MTMRKTWIIAVFLVIALLGGDYVGSPYWAARDLKEAVLRGDADRISQITDMAAIREGLKTQISAAFMRKIEADPDMRNNPSLKFDAMLVSAITAKIVDAYITPNGLVSILKNGDLASHNANDHATPDKITYDNEYLSLNQFRVTLRKSQSRAVGPSLLFERRGIFEWKLIRIELPNNLFQDMNSSPAKNSSAKP